VPQVPHDASDDMVRDALGKQVTEIVQVVDVTGAAAWAALSVLGRHRRPRQGLRQELRHRVTSVTVL